MSLSPSFRRALAGVATSFAVIAGTASTQAQIKPTGTQESPHAMFAATINEVCIPFSNTKRREKRYDEPLGLLADKIKSFSGWAEIEAGMKASGQAFEGLCPSTTSPPPVAPMPAIRGFAINLRDPQTGRGVDPGLLTQAVKDGHLDMLVYKTVLLANNLSTDVLNDPLIEPGNDLDTLILLNTVKIAQDQATTISLAVEQAVKEDKGEILKKLYESSPTRIALISDYHAQVIAAKKQNSDISNEARHTFRDKIMAIMLKDADMRLALGKLAAQAIFQDNAAKMLTDLEAEQTFTPLPVKEFNAERIKAKLSRFPGNIAGNDTVNTYKEFWQQQRAAGKDPLVAAEQYLDTLMEELKAKQSAIKQEMNKENGHKLHLQIMPPQ